MLTWRKRVNYSPYVKQDAHHHPVPSADSARAGGGGAEARSQGRSQEAQPQRWRRRPHAVAAQHGTAVHITQRGAARVCKLRWSSSPRSALLLLWLSQLSTHRSLCTAARVYSPPDRAGVAGRLPAGCVAALRPLSGGLPATYGVGLRYSRLLRRPPPPGDAGFDPLSLGKVRASGAVHSAGGRGVCGAKRGTFQRPRFAVGTPDLGAPSVHRSDAHRPSPAS